MGSRLDPLDEALRLWDLLTASERVRFLAHVTSSPRPDALPAADSNAPEGAREEEPRCDEF